MSFFEKLFGNGNLKLIDADFGELNSFSINGNQIGWNFKHYFFNSKIEISFIGNKDGIIEKQRQILLDVLANESAIKSESTEALKVQYKNAAIDFESIEAHFDLQRMYVSYKGFELSFQQKNNPHYCFNVYFENNKYVGVSVDS